MPRFDHFEPETPWLASSHIVKANFLEIDDFTAEMVELAATVQQETVEHLPVHAPLLHTDFSMGVSMICQTAESSERGERILSERIATSVSSE